MSRYGFLRRQPLRAGDEVMLKVAFDYVLLKVPYDYELNERLKSMSALWIPELCSWAVPLGKVQEARDACFECRGEDGDTRCDQVDITLLVKPGGYFATTTQFLNFGNWAILRRPEDSQALPSVVENVRAANGAWFAKRLPTMELCIGYVAPSNEPGMVRICGVSRTRALRVRDEILARKIGIAFEDIVGLEIVGASQPTAVARSAAGKLLRRMLWWRATTRRT